MPARKKDPAAELAEKMLQVLDAQRRLGGDSYPLPVRRLAELADPSAPEEVVRKAVNKKKPFGERAVVVQPKDLDSPVVLAEDAGRLADSLLLLDYLLPLVCTKDRPTCDPKKLKSKVPSRLKQPFETALQRRMDANELPAGVGLVRVRAKQHLHLQRYPIPRPPAVALAEDLVQGLRALRAQGDSAYPLTLSDLLRQVPSPGESDLLTKAVALPVFKRAVMLAVKPAADALGETPVALAEDPDRLANSPVLLTAALKRARQGDAQIFQPADLARQVVSTLKKPLAASLQRRAEAHSLPPGVGCLFQKKGKPWLFLLSDVAGIRSAVERPSRPAEPAPAPVAPAAGDFAQQFDAAFQLLNQQQGAHNLVSLADLRRAVPVARLTFDAELQVLQRAGRYSLSGAEGRHGVSPEEQAAGIPGRDTLLLYVSRRHS